MKQNSSMLSGSRGLNEPAGDWLVSVWRDDWMFVSCGGVVRGTPCEVCRFCAGCVVFSHNTMQKSCRISVQASVVGVCFPCSAERRKCSFVPPIRSRPMASKARGAGSGMPTALLSCTSQYLEERPDNTADEKT